MRRHRPYQAGEQVGRLTLLSSFQNTPRKGRSWRYRCACGTVGAVSDSNLKYGSVRSCGCLRREVSARRHRIHGESKKTPEWLAWKNMIDRCTNPHHRAYGNYGGRGISVCRKWRRAYLAFVQDVGRRPTSGHSLNRVDNEKGYFPGNVNWVTRKDQCRNKRNNLILEIDGVRKTMTEWALTSQINLQTFYGRLRRGWLPKAALTIPVDINASKQSYINLGKRKNCGVSGRRLASGRCNQDKGDSHE